jgi:hypothetical protein
MADQSRILEIERLLKRLLRDMDLVKSQVKEALQGVQRASGASGTGGGGATKVFWALSDGAAEGGGTWPTITPGSFTSDVYEFVDGELELVEEGAAIYWIYPDALENDGAPVPCVRLVGGGYIGLLEGCTPIPADGA